MSYTSYLVEDGSTSPETRLMTINPSPSASRARRGRISCQTSGSALNISVFFAGFSNLGSMTGVKRLGFARWVIGFGMPEANGFGILHQRQRSECCFAIVCPDRHIGFLAESKMHRNWSNVVR